MPQERWSIAEKMERELREGREDRKQQEMQRLPRRHLGAWAETVHRVELKGWTRALPGVPWGYGPVGRPQWWCHFKDLLRQERDELFNRCAWDN